MQYNSTRNNAVEVTSAKAIAQGISKDGGLFVPKSLPKLSDSDFSNLKIQNYTERAEYILKYFLTDFTTEEIKNCVEGAYLGGKFDDDNPAPLVELDKEIHILELWHGPTCAFKDLALQLLPHLLISAISKVAEDKRIIILVATSGDTGKAALEGFKDVGGTDIIVFYPEDGVSPMQKLQMNTQEGSNVFVSAIKGNFDDAQTGVKKIFTDQTVADKLAEKNVLLSSANSINWGRLVPQIIYYISSYCDLLENKEDLTQGFNIVVPTGNFGNILAAYYAKCMGVPINKLICASNSNNVLTDFISTGKYDRNRDFYTTISPSMDILISSNLERLLYHLSDKNDKLITNWMNELSETGCYSVDDNVLSKLKGNFWGGYCDDIQTKQTINEIFNKYNYLCDTHTAVAVKVYDDYVSETKDTRPVIIASTASPYKFTNDVLIAIDDNQTKKNEFDKMFSLSEITSSRIPKPILELKGKTTRFSNTCEKDDMLNTVLKYLKIK